MVITGLLETLGLEAAFYAPENGISGATTWRIARLEHECSQRVAAADQTQNP